jgi:NAD(P)-dependent dehydrogenase (short-subunit alcohol dehydrogenase family)
VVGFGRRAAALAETAATCPGMVTVVGDVTSRQDTAALIEEVLTRYGRIDALINNAGQNVFGQFLDTAFDDWCRVVETNLLGLARLTHQVLPVMLGQGHGRIVNLVSRAPEVCAAGTSAYAVSKGAVMLLTRAISNEIGAAGYPDVLINDLVPGPTRTAMNATGQDPAAVYPFVRDLVELPAGAASGKVYFQGKQYVPWANH